MVSFLIRDVVSHGISSRRTDCEGSVALLPGKASTDVLFHPIGRILLKISDYISDAMNRAETRQYVDVVYDTSNRFCDSIHSSNDPAQIRMQSWPPVGLDDCSSLLGRKNNMVMHAKECRAHESLAFLAPLPGCRSFSNCFRWSLTTGYFLAAFQAVVLVQQVFIVVDTLDSITVGKRTRCNYHCSRKRTGT